MSGHSKWNTIKRAKAVTDAKKGKAFTKIAKNISIAIKTGGGADASFNFQLRQALDKAREVGMPKDNIDRAISRGKGEGKTAVTAVTYEGYGPGGSALIVEAVTDNSNRTLQAIRLAFERNGGKMGGEGTVAWMFEAKGQILVEKSAYAKASADRQAWEAQLTLELIDQGVDDVKSSDEGLEIYTSPNDLEKIKKFVEAKGLKVLSAETIMKPQQAVEVGEADLTKVQALIDALNDDDDVVAVHTNTNL